MVLEKAYLSFTPVDEEVQAWIGSMDGPDIVGLGERLDSEYGVDCQLGVPESPGSGSYGYAPCASFFLKVEA